MDSRWLYTAVMKFLAAISLTAILTAGCVAHAAPPQTSDARRLNIEQLIDIKHPSNPMWAPDGQHVIFVWDRAGVSKVYVAETSTAPGQKPEARASARA